MGEESDDQTTEATEAPEGVAKKAGHVAKKVVKETGGFLSGLFMGPINTALGTLKGAWGGLTNISGMLMTTAGAMLTMQFMPSLVVAAGDAAGEKGKEVALKLAQDKAKDGVWGMGVDSLEIAALLNGGWGAVKGAANGAMGSTEGHQTTTSHKVGSMLGTGIVAAVGAFLVFNKVTSNHVGSVGPGDASPQAPGLTPPKTVGADVHVPH